MNDTKLEELLRTGQARDVVAAAKEASGLERVKLLKLAIRKIAFGAWPNAYLDTMIELGDAAVSEALALGEKDEANMVSYNMAANLCDCWGDGFERERRHFEKGLAYADRALSFRRELGKPEDRIAMAQWARGKHLLSLGRHAEAVDAFKESLAGYRRATSVEPEGLLAAEGFLALAKEASGDAEGKAELDRALDALKALKARDPSKADDAQGYIDQLAATRAKLG